MISEDKAIIMDSKAAHEEQEKNIPQSSTSAENTAPLQDQTHERTSSSNPPDTPNRPHASTSRYETLVVAEGMMDLVGNRGNGMSLQLASLATSIVITNVKLTSHQPTIYNPVLYERALPHPGASTATTVDLSRAIKSLSESSNGFEALLLSRLGSQIYPLTFNDTLLIHFGHRGRIPPDNPKPCDNAVALELLKSAWKNASAIEGGAVAEAIQIVVEEIYSAGVLDEMINEWEEAQAGQEG